MWSAIIGLMQILLMVGGSFIKPGYDIFGHNKYAHTHVCVQIKPNGANIREPYYLCNGLEFSPSLVDFTNWNQQQVANALDATKAAEKNYQVGSPYQQNAHLLQSHQNHHIVNFPHPGPSMPVHSDFYSFNPPTQAENFAPLNLGSNQANILFPTETIPICLNKFARAEEINQTNNEINNDQQLPVEAAKNNVNPEEFNALLDHEVLGAPNLAFSHNEMLAIRNTQAVPKLDIPLPLQAGPHIPREYLDDPVLRTFYNLDQTPNGNIEEPYFLTPTPQYNPALQAPALAPAPMMEDNFARYSYLKSKSHGPPTESLTPNKCLNNPSKFPPIFIAIPWLSPSKLDVLQNMQHISSCREEPNSKDEHTQTNLNTYRSQLRDNGNNWSIKDFSNKNSSLPLSKLSILLPTPASTTIIPASAEEDLFVEDTTTKADKVIITDDTKFNEDTQGNKGEIILSTTRAPHTTASAFNAMINAAKMHAMSLHTNNNPIQQVQNKREVSHVDSHGADHGTTVKKEYVKKLDKNYD